MKLGLAVMAQCWGKALPLTESGSGRCTRRLHEYEGVLEKSINKQSSVFMGKDMNPARPQ